MTTQLFGDRPMSRWRQMASKMLVLPDDDHLDIVRQLGVMMVAAPSAFLLIVSAVQIAQQDDASVSSWKGSILSHVVWGLVVPVLLLALAYGLWRAPRSVIRWVFLPLSVVSIVAFTAVAMTYGTAGGAEQVFYVLPAITVAFAYRRATSMMMAAVTSFAQAFMIFSLSDLMNALTDSFSFSVIIFGVTLAIGELRRKQDQARHLVAERINTDALTGVHSRQYLDTVLADLAGRQQLTEAALMMIDIDYFKDVNDTYGHGVGDEAIVHVAGLIKEHVGSAGIVGRVGGDELMVLMAPCSVFTAQDVAERIGNAVREKPLIAGEQQVPVALTVSVGVAQFPTHADQVSDLYTRADEALYQAKDAGRDRWAAAAVLAAGYPEVPAQRVRK